MVNNNTDTTRLLLANTSLLQLGKGESPTLTNLAIVADSLGANGGAEEVERTDTESGSLDLASLATAELATWLVKPGADAGLPVLAEVILVENYSVNK